MSPETWTIIAVGVALASILLASHRGLAWRIERLEDGQAELARGQSDLRERMAHLEGLPDGLREAIAHSRSA